MDFSPRQIQILFLLLHAKGTLNSGELARELKTSRRTIFRELNHVDKELKKYGITLERRAPQGFELVGDEKQRQALMQVLQSSDSFDPRNKEKRQQELLKALFVEDGLQKIYYYADLLQVSEGTISNDLEVIQAWLHNYGVDLKRKAGYGISLDYLEKHFRRALAAYEMSYEDRIFTDDLLQDHVIKIADRHGKTVLSGLTKESRKYYLNYAVVSVYRMLQGHYIDVEEHGNEMHNSWYASFLEGFFQDIQKEYHIDFGSDKTCLQEEMYQMYVYLAGCKRQQADHVTEQITLDRDIIDLRELVYDLINHYDPSVAYLLKQDEDFINGLMAHLASTIMLLKEGRSIVNQMLEEEKRDYPDIFANAIKAAKVLEERLDCSIPEDEVGFLAIHFGGALYRLRAGAEKKRTVRIAVVCSGGIGISAFMSTKLRHHFENKIEVETVREDRLSDADADFVVSPFPVETMLDCIVADPLLGPDYMKRIAWMVDMHALHEKKESAGRKVSAGTVSIAQVRALMEEVDSIQEHFSCVRIPEDVTFDEAERIIAGMVADSREATLSIYQAFVQREAKSTQVIEGLRIVFLHARSAYVKNSCFMVVLPEQGCFTDPYFKGSGAVVVMLIPEEEKVQRTAAAYISQALFEDEEFLSAIINGNADFILHKVDEILEIYVNDSLSRLLTGEDF